MDIKNLGGKGESTGEPSFAPLRAPLTKAFNLIPAFIAFFVQYGKSRALLQATFLKLQPTWTEMMQHLSTVSFLTGQRGQLCSLKELKASCATRHNRANSDESGDRP